MKVYIEGDEIFPVWDIYDNDSYDEVEVPDETVKRWKKVMSEFWEVQREMNDLMKKRNKSE